MTYTKAAYPVNLPRPDGRRGRGIVLGVCIAALVVKAFMAATTYGTNDTGHWLDFSHAIRAVGPVRVYGFHFQSSLYNHPPLVGYLLLGMNALTHLGMSVMFVLRLVSSLADVISALIVYEMVDRRRSHVQAVVSGALVGASPVLFVISGFHGNTDPIFVMFALLAVYLLADRHMPILAGAAMTASFSIKIVPFVVVPPLLGFAAVQGRRTFLRFAGAMAATAALIWLPALATEWSFVRENVLGYTGALQYRWWGIPQFAAWGGATGLRAFLGGPFRIVLLLACTGLPALGVWRRPDRVAECTGLALCGVLLLSPTSATQYLAWAVAPAYLIGVWTATAYNLAAGLTLVVIYTRWSGTFWWNHAYASLPTPPEQRIAAIAWLALLSVVVEGAMVVATGEPLSHRLRPRTLP